MSQTRRLRTLAYPCMAHHCRPASPQRFSAPNTHDALCESISFVAGTRQAGHRPVLPVAHSEATALHGFQPTRHRSRSGERRRRGCIAAARRETSHWPAAGTRARGGELSAPLRGTLHHQTPKRVVAVPLRAFLSAPSCEWHRRKSDLEAKASLTPASREDQPRENAQDTTRHSETPPLLHPHRDVDVASSLGGELHHLASVALQAAKRHGSWTRRRKPPELDLQKQARRAPGNPPPTTPTLWKARNPHQRLLCRSDILHRTSVGAEIDRDHHRGSTGDSPQLPSILTAERLHPGQMLPEGQDHNSMVHHGHLLSAALALQTMPDPTSMR